MIGDGEPAAGRGDPDRAGSGPAGSGPANLERSAPGAADRDQVDYLTLGNPTLDVRPDGTRQIGGSVVYATLQAARLGWSARAVGRGRAADLEPLWLPFAGEASLRLWPAEATTMFCNRMVDGARAQWVEATAGLIADVGPLPRARVAHLAPIAAEFDLAATVDGLGSAGLVGLTPQGLVRRWDRDGLVRLSPLAVGAETARDLDAVVFADYEAPYLEELAREVQRAGGVVVVTRAGYGCEVRSKHGSQEFGAFDVGPPVDETGAGDVFSTTFFVAVEGGMSVRKAVQLASAAAALKITGVGPGAVARLDDIVELSVTRDL